jgi:hypothetical protein
MGTEFDGEQDEYVNSGDLEDQYALLTGLTPDLNTEDSAAWQMQLTGAGLFKESEYYIALSRLYEQAFSSNGSEEAVLRLKLKLLQIGSQVQTDLFWNQGLLTQLENLVEEGGTQEGRKSELEGHVSEAEAQLFLSKADLLHQILSSCSSVPVESLESEPWFEYARYLESVSYEVSADDLLSLSALTDLLEEVNDGSMSHADALLVMNEKSLSWLKVLTGESNELPGQMFLDLYLSEPLSQFSKARAELEGWWLAASSSPLMTEETLGHELMGDFNSGLEFVEEMMQFGSLESLLDRYYPLIENETLPEYLELSLNRLISQVYGQDLEALNPDSSVSAQQLICIQDQIAAFGATEAQIEALVRTDEGRSIFREAGYQNESDELEHYELLLQWKSHEEALWEEAWEKALLASVETSTPLIEPDLDLDLLFSEFLVESGSDDLDRTWHPWILIRRIIICLTVIHPGRVFLRMSF